MRLFHTLSETPIGRALLAWFFDLPRWTLANVLFTLSLAPSLLALLGGGEWPDLLTLPAALVGAGIINMAARPAREDAPRWRDMFAYPTTFLIAFTLWAGLLAALRLLSGGLHPAILFIAAAFVLALLMIGMCALFMPALLGVQGGLVWRNALVLAVHAPVVALGLPALLAVGAWAVWASRGALLLVAPALWAVIAAFAVQDRIAALRASAPGD